MVIVLLASGFEELEALTPVDILRRNNIDVRTVSVSNERNVTGTHGIQVSADLMADDVPMSEVEMLILPGGMPGVSNLDVAPATHKFIEAAISNSGHLAAICAAPSIFGKHGMLNNTRATCFPGFEDQMLGAILTADRVVTDGLFTTARDYTCSAEFSFELLRILAGKVSAVTEPKSTSVPENTPVEVTKDSFPVFDLPSSNTYDLDLGEDDAICDKDTGTKKNGTAIDEVDNTDDIEAVTDIIKGILETHAVDAEVKNIVSGPRITLYELAPARGTKVCAITNLYNELAVKLARDGIRLLAPVPGKSTIGIEVPNKNQATVSTLTLLGSDMYKSGSKTLAVIGKNTDGTALCSDVAKFPHALICGSAGTGKSVLINSILTSLIYKNTPEELKLILIDPKAAEFKCYAGIPHLLVPVITDTRMAVGALTWAVDEMERRYSLIEEHGVRSIDAYNSKVSEDPSIGAAMPRIIIVIDELADVMTASKAIAEELITRLAQKSRAAGLHLIISTQNPKTNVVTAVMKANIPTKIAFKLSTAAESKTVIDRTGAEKLLGNGDMLFTSPYTTSAARVQGAYISKSELTELIDDTEKKYTSPTHDTAVLEKICENASKVKIRASKRSSVPHDEV